MAPPSRSGGGKSTPVLSESFLELEHLYQSLPVGLCLIDRDLRFIRINEKLAAINGFPVEAHIGRTLRQVFPEVESFVEKIYREVIDTGKAVQDMEIWGATPAHLEEQRCYLVSHFPLKDETGLVQAVSTVVQDITHLKKTKKDLENVDIHFRLLLETTTAIPWRADARTWRFTYVGPQAAKVFGYPIEHWYNKDFWADHIHPEDRDFVLSTCLDRSSECKDYEFEYRMLTRSGKVVWVHDIVTVESKEGKPETLYGFLIDITKRKETEQALKASEERYRDLYDHAPDMFGSVDASTGLVLQCNDTLSKRLGLEKSDIVGKHLFELYHPDCREQMETAFQRFQQEGEVQDMELLLKRVDGKKIAVSLNSSAVRDENGKVLHSRHVWRDITKRKETEEELRSSESALRESREQLHHLARDLIFAQEAERRRLASELHDDLTQQLAVLAIEAGKLEKKMVASKSPGQKELAKMRKHMVQLSKDIHAMAHRLHPSILDDLGLVSAIEAACDGLRQREDISVTYKPAQVSESLPKELSLCVYRVVQECLQNVAKHSEAGSVEVSLEEKKGSLVLIVKDTGKGFDPAAIRGRGGMGLASMKERIRHVQGEFTIHACPGQGTQIQAEIPLPEAHP